MNYPQFATMVEAEDLARNPSEARMTSRLLDYWDSLAVGRRFPARDGFRIEAVNGLGANAFTLDFSQGYRDPTLRYVGTALSEACGRNVTGKPVSAVPRGSVLSWVAEHYMDVIANRGPVEFEDAYENSHGSRTLFRGVMLPFSEDGENIDFAVGAITFKTKSSETTPADETDIEDDLDVAAEIDKAAGNGGAPEPGAADLDDDFAISILDPDAVPERALGIVDDDFLVDDTDDGILDAYPQPPGEAGSAFVDDSGPPLRAEAGWGTAPEPVVGPDGQPVEGLQNLTETLDYCRALARELDAAELKSRKALYRTLESAYAFYFECEANPEAYEALREKAGIGLQERAPFTPIVKMVFGIDYDRKRLSEYATALAYAKRHNQIVVTVRGFIEEHEGGIKGCVKAERAARRAETGNGEDTADTAMKVLRKTRPIGRVRDSGAGDAEFVVMIGRRARGEKGTVQILRVLDEKPSLVEGIVKRAAKKVAGELGRPAED